MQFVLDAYAARSCPVKTHNAFHPGLSRSPGDESLREAFHGGLAFEAEVLAELLAQPIDSVADLRAFRQRPSSDQEAALAEAVEARAELIIDPLLPRDWAGHRSGRPDLLIRAKGGGYYPALIKFQRVIEARGDQSELTHSTVAAPRQRRTIEGFRFRWGWRLNTALQLAHYWRMLQAQGLAAAQAWGAVVGTDDLASLPRGFTWLRLDQPQVPSSPRLAVEGDEAVPVSVLQRYDQEFLFREQVAIAAAAQGADDPPVLRPIVNRECSYCQWYAVCRTQLDDDDLSLRINKSPLDVYEIAVLRDLGVETVGALAEVDIEGLLPSYLPRVTHRVGAEDRLRLAWRRSVLMAHGIDFDRVTTGPIRLPSAPLEIDIDVETSVDDRVYLWGFLVTDTTTGGSEYRHFSAFTELDDEGERRLAIQAMAWLRDLVGDREAVVFHYSDYEVLRIERLAASGDPQLMWAAAYAREHFFDLFAPIREHFFGTQGLGLKVVASKAAGFSWRDESPGGLNSQGWFADAVHADSATGRDSARRRVLEYNEDDVRATWHVRRWLRDVH